MPVKARVMRPYRIQKGKKGNFKRYKRNQLFRSVYPNAVYTASETFVMSNPFAPIQFAAGANTYSQSLQVAMNDIPQVTHYAAMFRQFCIRHVSYKIVPRWGEADLNTQSYNVLGPGSTGITNSSNFRIHYAVVDTPFVGPPASEKAIVQNNNVRTRILNSRIFKIAQAHPKPELVIQTVTSAQTNMTIVGDQWFNFTDSASSTTQGGQNIPHGNVQVWVQGSGGYPNGVIIADIYAKVTFSCRNPN